MSNLAVVQPKSLINEDDIKVLKNSKFKNFTDAEIQYCVKVVNALNLNPFLNQIHFVKRKNHKDNTYAVVTQIGIDGFRLIAERSGGYAGSDEPKFDYDLEDKYKERPIKSTITVHKIIQGIRCAFIGEARWNEYYPGSGNINSFMWDKMPHGQLSKCAEALALRKAFPAELSSVYADEEMDQAAPLTVFPEQPEAIDGVKKLFEDYRVPGGTYVKRGLHEIDPKELADYIVRIEKRLEKNPAKKPEWWDDFVARAEGYLADLELGKLEPEEFEENFDGENK